MAVFLDCSVVQAGCQGVMLCLRRMEEGQSDSRNEKQEIVESRSGRIKWIIDVGSVDALRRDEQGVQVEKSNDCLTVSQCCQLSLSRIRELSRQAKFNSTYQSTWTMATNVRKIVKKARSFLEFTFAEVSWSKCHSHNQSTCSPIGGSNQNWTK